MFANGLSYVCSDCFFFFASSEINRALKNIHNKSLLRRYLDQFHSVPFFSLNFFISRKRLRWTGCVVILIRLHRRKWKRPDILSSTKSTRLLKVGHFSCNAVLQMANLSSMLNKNYFAYIAHRILLVFYLCASHRKKLEYPFASLL